MVKSYLRFELSAQFGLGLHSAVSPISYRAPNGADLAITAVSDTVKICHLSSGRAFTLWTGSSASTRVSALDISTLDGTIAAAHSSGVVRLWDTSNIDFERDQSLPKSEPRVTLPGHRAAVTVVKWYISDQDSTSMFLVSGSASGEIIVWDVSSKSPVHRLEAHVNAISGIAVFTRTGSTYLLASSVDGNIRVFSAESGICVQTLPAASQVLDLRCDHSARYLVARTSKLYELYSIAEDISEDGKMCSHVGSFAGYNVLPTHCSFDVTAIGRDSFIAVANTHCEVALYKFRTFEEAKKNCRRRAKRMQKYALKKDPSTSNPVSKSEDSSKEVPLIAEDFFAPVAAGTSTRSVAAVSCLKIPSRDNSGLKGADVTKISVLLTSESQEMDFVRVVPSSSQSGTKRRHLERNPKGKKCAFGFDVKASVGTDGHGEDVNSVAMCSGDSLVMSGGREELKIWNLDDARCTLSLKISGSISCCSFLTYDGSHGVAGFKNGDLAIFDTRSGIVVHHIRSAHSGVVKDMWCNVANSDTKLITCGSDGAIRYWDFSEMNGCKVSPSGEFRLREEVSMIRVEATRHNILCAALLDCTVRCVDLKSNQEKLALYGHKLPVIGMDISSDGNILVTSAGDRTVKVWGLEFGDCRRSFNSGSAPVRAIVFQPRTHLFFTGSTDGSVQYWDGDKLQYIAPVHGHLTVVRFLSISPDGELLVSVGNDRVFRIWRRTDEQIFLEEEKEERLAAALEMGDGNISKDLITSSRVYTEFDLLVKALELCNPNMQTIDQPAGLDLRLLGMEPHEYVCRALLKVPSAVLDRDLGSLSASEAAYLADCIQTSFHARNGNIISGEAFASAAILISKNFGSEIIQRLNGRKLVRNLYAESKAALNESRDIFGFCQSALRLCENTAKYS